MRPCRFTCALLVAGGLSVATTGHPAEDTLTIGTWGGAYEAAQQAALFQPFERKSGLEIVTTPYHGGLDALHQAEPPQLLDMLEEEALVACEQGLLIPLDAAQLLGPGQVEDFLPQSISPCAIAHLTFSTVMAFNESAFPGIKPRHINDLFDFERFPGKRALQKHPAALFEWALMAEGVPISQIYDLLSTTRGLRLVSRRLEALRGQVVWWETPGEAVDLLESGEAVMASGYNGRFFDAWLQGSPLRMIWDGQIIDRSVWAIPNSPGGKAPAAREFLRSALTAQAQARMARHIPYGPTRRSAFEYIGLHSASGIVMSDHLPTAPHHLDKALYRDAQWYARTGELRERHFKAWLDAGK